MSALWRGARRVLGGRVRAALALLALCALPALRVRRAADTRADFPRHSPAQLAHFLADFSNQPRLHTHIGAWRLVEESTDYACWRYEVSYECGARCEGRALVSACDASATGPRREHGAPHAQRVTVLDRRCWRPPALPWPSLCESLETQSEVRARAGGGALLAESAHATCGVLGALAGHCDVRALRLQHHRALRDALG